LSPSTFEALWQRKPTGTEMGGTVGAEMGLHVDLCANRTKPVYEEEGERSLGVPPKIWGKADEDTDKLLTRQSSTVSTNASTTDLQGSPRCLSQNASTTDLHGSPRCFEEEEEEEEDEEEDTPPHFRPLDQMFTIPAFQICVPPVAVHYAPQPHPDNGDTSSSGCYIH